MIMSNISISEATLFINVSLGVVIVFQIKAKLGKGDGRFHFLRHNVVMECISILTLSSITLYGGSHFERDLRR